MSSDREFIYGLPQMTRVLANVRVPFTRTLLQWDKYPPYANYAYKSMFELSAESSAQMAAESLDDLMSGGAARMHSGQTTAGLLASGLSASGIRVPEVQTGALVAVSL